MLVPSATKAEPPLRVSRWLSLQVLLDADELEGLLTALDNPHMVCVGGVVPRGAAVWSREQFLEDYENYIEHLKLGQQELAPKLRMMMSSAWSREIDAFYSLPCPEGRELVKARLPVVQLQPHRLAYSKLEGKFRAMVQGEDSLSWGLQFSYPQLYQETETGEVKEANALSGGKLYRELHRYLRKVSVPTPFLVGGVTHNVPMRLGKNCFAWVNELPQLARHGITVKELPS